MHAARHARIKELFEAVRSLPAPERAAFLAREWAGDAELEPEVRHHEAAAGFLSGRASERARPSEPKLPRFSVPGYRIERELGRGGMGVVLLAEQERPRRAVALKFLRLDSLGAGGV